MNIFKREFKANLKALVIWCASFGLLMGLASVEYSVYKDQGDELSEFLNALPEAFRQALALDILRLDVPEGFLSYIAGYLVLAAVIYAALGGAQILSREINKKTAETTFTLPITRTRMIGIKLVLVLVNCVILATFTYLAIIAAFSPYDIDSGFVASVGKFIGIIILLQWLFVMIGLFISALIKRHKRAGTITAAVAVGTYFLAFITKLSEDTEFLKYFTPFEYFPAVSVINDLELEIFGFIVVPLLIAVLFVSSFRLIRMKDIQT